MARPGRDHLILALVLDLELPPPPFLAGADMNWKVLGLPAHLTGKSHNVSYVLRMSVSHCPICHYPGFLHEANVDITQGEALGSMTVP